MDKVESMKILAILRIAYPGFYRGTSEKDHSDTVVLWATMFPDDPFVIQPAAKMIHSIVRTSPNTISNFFIQTSMMEHRRE